MAEFSFWARGDSNSANNASVNSRPTSQIPTTKLTFSSGTNGDVKLDYVPGGIDPDTKVIVGTNTYDFRVEFTGTLPNTKGLTNVAGTDVTLKPIIVVTVLDGSPSGTRYYFLTDGSGSYNVMNAMPNGALPIGNVQTPTAPVLICFAQGTMIDTPSGRTKIENLKAGDHVLNDQGDAMPIRWIGSRHISGAMLERHPNLRPVRVPAGTFGPGLPESDLFLSRQHRVMLEGWEVELNFGIDRVLVPVAHLIGDVIHVDHACTSVTYFHMLFDDHELVVSEGLVTESYQPARRTVADMVPATQSELFAIFPELELSEHPDRPDALPSIKAQEATVLHDMILTHQDRAAA